MEQGLRFGAEILYGVGAPLQSRTSPTGSHKDQGSLMGSYKGQWLPCRTFGAPVWFPMEPGFPRGVAHGARCPGAGVPGRAGPPGTSVGVPRGSGRSPRPARRVTSPAGH